MQKSYLIIAVNVPFGSVFAEAEAIVQGRVDNGEFDDYDCWTEDRPTTPPLDTRAEETGWWVAAWSRPDTENAWEEVWPWRKVREEEVSEDAEWVYLESIAPRRLVEAERARLESLVERHGLADWGFGVAEAPSTGYPFVIGHESADTIRLRSFEHAEAVCRDLARECGEMEKERAASV